MFCTDKEQLTCNSEKLGCEGCFYYNDKNKDEIKCGEYVRYKSGAIRKVSRIIPCYENDKLLKDSFYIEFDNKGDIATYHIKQVKEFITKHSSNIIDLVEVGDYVNGKKVIEIDNCKGAMRELYVEGQNSEEDCGLYFEQIETVVTKEQFKSIEYRLED